MLNPRPIATAATPAPGARALYLGAGQHKRVTCTDEALVVTNARAQTWRYPLDRVARVVSSTATDWSGAALALCLRRGIGIAWLDPRGAALGVCYPQARSATGSAAALEIMVETPEGVERYRHWQRARRMDVLMRWSAGREAGIAPAEWEAAKRQWVYAGEYPVHLPAGLRGHCLASIGSALARHALPPALWGPKAQRIDLDEDLCELLWAEMNLCAGNLADAAEGDRPLAEWFERWAARNAAALHAHLYSLERTALKALAT